MRRAVGALVALMLCSCAHQPVASIAPPPATAQAAECDLSLADVLKLGGNDARQMTGPEFEQWGHYAAKHGAPMQPGMSAYVVPHIDAQDDEGILVADQGCVVLWVSPFTAGDLGRLFKGEDIDGQDGPEI